jgi:hypothetical protein
MLFFIKFVKHIFIFTNNILLNISLSKKHQSQKKPIKNGEKMNTSIKWVLLEYLFYILYIIQKKNP